MFPYSVWAHPIGSFVEPVPPPDVDPDSGSQVCVTFNATWLPFVIGALQQLVLQSTWEGDKDGIELAQNRAYFLIYMFGTALASCGGSMLRQNPTNSCQLQQSDDGVTWTLAFDYSLCTPPAIQQLVDSNNGAQQTAWDGATPSQINLYAPQTTWSMTTGDTIPDRALRGNALCNACEFIVSQACANYVSAFNGTLKTQNLVAYALGAAAGLVSIVADTIFLPLGLAIGAAALEIFTQYQSIVTDTIASNAGYQADISCWLFEQLLTQSINKTTFQAALSTTPSYFSTDEVNLTAAIQAMFASNIQGQDEYAAFVNFLGGTYQAGKSGVTVEGCACPTPPYIEAFDTKLNFGTIIGGDPVFNNNYGPVPFGELVASSVCHDAGQGHGIGGVQSVNGASWGDSGEKIGHVTFDFGQATTYTVFDFEEYLSSGTKIYAWTAWDADGNIIGHHPTGLVGGGGACQQNDNVSMPEGTRWFAFTMITGAESTQQMTYFKFAT